MFLYFCFHPPNMLRLSLICLQLTSLKCIIAVYNNCLQEIRNFKDFAKKNPNYVMMPLKMLQLNGNYGIDIFLRTVLIFKHKQQNEFILSVLSRKCKVC